MARKGLPTLIRMQQRELDTLRRRMLILTQNRDSLLEQSEALLEVLNEEVRLAGELAGMSGFFGDYSNRIKKQREGLHREAEKLQRKMDALSVEISNAFGELKKLEIALENQLREERKKRERDEQKQMDEIAARRHRDTV
jgi:flagellar export protein FliJ